MDSRAGRSLMQGTKIKQRQLGPKRPHNASACPYSHVNPMHDRTVGNPEARAKIANEQNLGPPPGVPTGNPQSFDISSHVGETQEQASDSFSDYDCEHCPHN